MKKTYCEELKNDIAKHTPFMPCVSDVDGVESAYNDGYKAVIRDVLGAIDIHVKDYGDRKLNKKEKK